MALPVPIAVTSIRGDTVVLHFIFWQDVAKTIPIDFTGATLTSQLRINAADPDPPEATWDIDVSGNMVDLTLLPSITEDLAERTVWDLECDWDSDDVRVQTIATGSLALTQDVTRV